MTPGEPLVHVVGLIPARGGSKGIPRKNLVELAGKPLVAWTIGAACAASSVSRAVAPACPRFCSLKLVGVDWLPDVVPWSGHTAVSH